MAGTAGYSAWSLYASGQRLLESADLLLRLEEVASDAPGMQNSARGYLITGKPQFLAAYEQGRETLKRDAAALTPLIARQAQLQRGWSEASREIELLIAELDLGVSLRSEVEEAAAEAHVASGRGQALLEQVQGRLASLKQDLGMARKSQLAEARQTGFVTASILVGGLAANFLFVVIALVTGRQYLQARSQAEQAELQARQYADNIVDTVREALLILTTDLRVHRSNRSFHLAFGGSAEEIQGKRLDELAGGAWSVPDLLSRLKTVVPAQTELQDYELIIGPPGPSQRLLLLNARKLYRPGNHTELLLLAIEDVTARRQAEEERDRFFTLSIDLLCIAGSDGYMKRVSPAVEGILGWTPEEFMARPFLDFVHPDDQAATLVEVERMVKAGEKVLNFENRYQHRNGGWRVLSWRATPHQDGMMYANARDVTDRRRAEEEILRLNEQLSQRAALLEASNSELEAFSYSVSHDLRAPLRHVEGFAQLLRKHAGPALDATGTRYVETIISSARKLGVLIDDLLQFSRLGREEMRVGRIDMRALVEDVKREGTAGGLPGGCMTCPQPAGMRRCCAKSGGTCSAMRSSTRDSGIWRRSRWGTRGTIPAAWSSRCGTMEPASTCSTPPSFLACSSACMPSGTSRAPAWA
jgi:PAS domain S-box-containing protein